MEWDNKSFIFHTIITVHVWLKFALKFDFQFEFFVRTCLYKLDLWFWNQISKCKKKGNEELNDKLRLVFYQSKLSYNVSKQNIQLY